MADIKPKRKSAIQRGQVHSYDPNNFNPEPFFITTDDPDVILKNIKPYLGKYISVDTETHPLHMNSHEVPKGMVRRWVGKGKAAVPQDLPFCISISDGTQCFTMYDSLENGFSNIIALKPLLEDTSIEKIFHNYKFDGHELANIGVKVKGKIHDTVVLTKLVDENRPAFTLVTLARALPKGITLYEDMVDNYKKTHKIVDYRQIPRPLLSAYANADVWNCIHVFIDEYAKLEKDELVPLYTTELELMLCLFEMERVGMRVNLDYEKPLKEDLQKLMDDAEKEIYEEVGGLFNINSGKQLYNVLLKLGVDRTFIAMSDKGNPVLDKDALNDLAEKHGVSIVLKILEFRKYEKLLGTYAVGIYAQRDSVGRVHCSINQTEATTGRMSITKPALQTLHKKDKTIRKIFVPEDDFTLFFMDYEQVEYRIFASYAKATALIDAIAKGYDVHQATAGIIYNVPFEEVTDEQRSKAKTVNFAILYGAGEAKLALGLSLTASEARTFKAMYFAQLPEAEPFISQVQRVTKTRGYIKNLYGRRRRLTYNECYKAPNALIQGCAADLIKAKLVVMYKFLKEGNYRTRMVMVCHDEVIFEAHNEEFHILSKLKWLMSEYEKFRVPIETDVEMGSPSWGEKTSYEIDAQPLSAEELQRVYEYDLFK